MKILELFAGTRSVGKAFEKAGHEVFSVDWDTNQKGINWYGDIEELSADLVLKLFGKPDIIWASPDCRTYSIAGWWRHRKRDMFGRFEPVSDYAKKCDSVNRHLRNLIAELCPKYYFIENPRGLMRQMGFVADLERYTITYCQYDYELMKPTDIFTNHPNPNFKPMCNNGDKCHVSAPRGSGQGLASVRKNNRIVIPQKLCEHIVSISEKEEEVYCLC